MAPPSGGAIFVSGDRPYSPKVDPQDGASYAQ